jgi:CRISPR-associated exonuclease Cas4
MVNEEANLTGSAFYNYVICPRKAWLMQYQIDPEREHDLLAEGRLNNIEHYQRTEKELPLPGIKVDLLRREGAELVIGEVKKSSSGLEASVLQLSYYLYRLEESGVKARGEVLIPKERKKIPVVLDEPTRTRLSEAMLEITELLLTLHPPKAEWIKFCPNCAYAEFCWS